MKRKALLILFITVLVTLASAQENKRLAFNAGFDIYSRYVWRGLSFSDAPNIQPYMTFTLGNWSLTGFGSYATSKNYAEIDVFLSYSNNGFTFNLNDYYNEDEQDLSAFNYGDWNRSTTSHLLEASMVFDGTLHRFPLILTASTMVYGADLNTRNNQNYSTYFEAKYPFALNDYSLSLFAGGTINKGFYADKAAIVNIGLESNHEVKFSDYFSLPVKASFYLNPNQKDVFLVLGISF